MLKRFKKNSLDPIYLVYAPHWMDDVGGIIFLHRLVHELRLQGEEAYLYPLIVNQGVLRKLKSLVAPIWYPLSPDLDTSVWPSKRIPDNAIVVYPEVVLGNPIGAKNIARWLMHPPGVKNPYEFTSDELFFKVSDYSDNPEISGGAQLLALWWLHPEFENLKNPNRSGTCFMLRKGNETILTDEQKDWIRLDGKSQSEIASTFNSCEFFVSYDEATMYSLFAAICGCISVVLSDTYPNRTAWVAERPIAKYGVAYGWNDLEHARNTQHLVMDHVLTRQAKSTEGVQAFVSTTRRAFGFQLAS